MAKATLTPAEIADKQIRRSQAAVTDYKSGVMAVTESPMKKAADAADLWLQGIQQAHADGSFQAGLNAVSLEDWKNATATKGGASYASGVAASRDKIIDFQQQRASAQAGIDNQLAQMPRGDLQTNIQRMVTQVQGMANFAFKKRRR